MADKVTNLHKALINSGYAMESEDDFRRNLNDPKKRRAAYDALVSSGYSMEDYSDFETNIGYGAKSQATTTTAAPPTTQSSAQPTVPAVSAQPAQGGWTPTVGERISMLHDVNNVVSGFNTNMKGASDKVKRNFEANTDQGRARARTAEMMARQHGLSTRPAAVGLPSVDAGGEGESSSEGSKFVSMRSPEVYDVVSDGKGGVKQRWMLPDGTLTDDYMAAANAEWGAQTARLQGEFVKRMERNGLDVGNQEDVEKQAQLDFEAPMRRTMDNIWSNAESRYSDLYDSKVRPLREAFSGAPTTAALVGSTQVGSADLKAYNEAFDFDDMVERLWSEQGTYLTTALGNEDEARKYAAYMVYDYAKSKHLPRNKAEYFMNQVADNNLITSIVRGFSRKPGAEGDWDSVDAAMEEYGRDKTLLRTMGSVTGMALDPTTTLSGGIGGLATTGFAKYVGRGSVQLGSRLIASTGSKRLLAVGGRRLMQGMVGGAASIGSYNLIKDSSKQFERGGFINPETGENEGYKPMEVLESTAEGLILGAGTGAAGVWLGNVGGKLVKGKSLAAKAGIRTGQFATNVVVDGTIFSTPAWIKGEGDTWDVWTDNMAFALGIKSQHGIMGGVRTVSEGIESLKNGGRKGLKEYVDSRLEGIPNEMELTSDEITELSEKGYGRFGDLFDKKKHRVSSVTAERTREGELMSMRIDDVEHPELVGYNDLEAAMYDNNLSQAVRAKLWWILTGRTLPCATITGVNFVENEDGSFRVESTSVEGVVTSRRFKDRKSAETERENILHQATRNSISIGEQFNDVYVSDACVERAVNDVAESHGLNEQARAELKEKLRALATEGREPEANDKVMQGVYSLAQRYLREAVSETSEGLRRIVSARHGVEFDEVLKKDIKELSEKESAALKEYDELLYRFSKERQAETEPTPEQREAQTAYDEAKLLYGRFEEGDPRAQAEADAIALRMHEAYELVEEAFGEEAEYWMYQVGEDPWGVLGNEALTPEQREAVLYYVNSASALEGIMDAARDATERKRQEVTQSVNMRTHKDLGVIQPATMKVDNKVVYIVLGNVRMFDDGKGVDKANSDSYILIFDPEIGEVKPTSPEMIYRVDAPINPQDEMRAALAQIDEEQSSIFSEGIFAVAKRQTDERDILAGQTASLSAERGGRPAEEPTEAEGNPIAPEENREVAQDDARRPIADVEKYDEGYEVNIERGPKLSDDELNREIADLRDGAYRLTDYGRGMLEALEYEQQNRMQRGNNGAENIPQNGNNGAENIPTPTEETALQADTALSRIPINEETQEPDFERAPDKETAWDGLVEAVGEEKDAVDIAQAQIEQARADLEALKKKPPTMKAPKLKGSPMAMAQAKRAANEKYQQDMDAYNQTLADTHTRLDAWNDILGVYNSRKAEARRIAEEERRVRDAQAHDEAVARFEVQQRIKAEKEAEQAAIGTHAVNPKIKEKWDSTPKSEGHSDIITLPDGSQLRGKYVLYEAGAASASHDPNNGFTPTEGFPIDANGQSVNDRDYQRDKDAQRIVEDMAGAYDNRALQNPVVVSQDGIVLSGNNRTMSGDLAARRGTDQAYNDYLKEFGGKYGFTPEQIAGMEHPRVAFVPEEALPYDATTFSRFNAQEMKSQSKPEAAVKLGKIVPENVFNSIVNDISRHDRMGDYYGDEKAVAFALGSLMQAGVINDKQLPELRTGTALSAAGKELIENTLIGKIFQSNPDAVRQLIAMPNVRQAVVMALSEIANNRTLAGAGYDLSSELGKAIDLVFRAKTAHPDIFTVGVPVSPFGRTQGLFDDEFGDSRVTDATTLLLADILNSNKTSDLRKVLATYNKDAGQAASGQMDIFSGDIESKETILTRVNEHFKNATSKEQQAIIDAAIADRKNRAGQQQSAGGSPSEQTPIVDERSGEVGLQYSDQEPTTPKANKRSIRTIDPREMTDEERSTRGERLKDAEAIEVQEGIIQRTDELTARQAAEKWWDDNVGEPAFYDTEAGEVEINRHSIENSLAHKYGQMKLDAITSLVDGFENAVYLGTMPDFTRQEGAYNHYFAYPINYNGKRCYVFCRAMQDANQNRLYVHEVFVEDKITKGDTLQTAASQPHGGIALYRDILANVLETYNRHTTEKQPAETAEASQDVQQSGTDTTSSMNAPTLPADKGSENPTDTQIKEPTEAQKLAGNYKKKHIRVDGYDISIENEKGSIRRGKDADGTEWETEMQNDYGYIRGTKGKDGDHIDVYLSETPEDGDVFVIDQVNADGSFDEHKVMYGFPDINSARDAYLSNYKAGWTGLGTITQVSKDEFKKWIKSSKRKTKPFAEYAGVKQIASPTLGELKVESQQDNGKVSDVEDGIGAVLEWREAKEAWAKYEARHLFDRKDSPDYAEVQKERARLSAEVDSKREAMERMMSGMNDNKFVQAVEASGLKWPEGPQGMWDRYRRIGEQAKAKDLFGGIDSLDGIEPSKSGKFKLIDVSARAESERLKGVYHDAESGMAVSSDAGVLVASKAVYDKAKSGKLVDKKGEERKGMLTETLHYPPVSKVIPKGAPEQTVPLTEPKLERMAGQIKAVLKGMKPAEANRQAVSVRFPNGEIGFYDAKRLALFFDGMRHIGEYGIETFGANRPIAARGAGGAALLMPLHPDYAGNPGKYGFDVKYGIDLSGNANDAGMAMEPGAEYNRGESIEAVNARFNEQLQQQIDGKLPQGHVYELGMPSNNMRNAGFPALPIRMRASLLTYKSTMNRHPLEISDVKGLVKALANPVAVFEYSKDNMRNVIVDITHGDKHFLVGFTLNYQAGDIEINSVSGLFPKDTASWLKWVQDGKAIQIGQKDKVQALIDSLRTNPADAERIGLNLDDVAKVVKEFENPKLEGVSRVKEARRRYGRRRAETQIGKSLFDWAEEQGSDESLAIVNLQQSRATSSMSRGQSSESKVTSSEMEAAEQANAAINRYVEEYRNYWETTRELSEREDMSEEEKAMMEQQEDFITEARGRLEQALREFYVLNNTPHDASRIASEMAARAEAETLVRLNRPQILRDILEGKREGVTTVNGTISNEVEVRTATGLISYNAIGHLPDAKAGEFCLAERKFSLSGEFDFTGKDRIQDRGDVAYLFRALESYAIEHVFGVLVKDGRPHIVHIGMGAPTMSVADLSVLRAAYDAFGADKVYLLHNHPSGKLVPSVQDEQLMRRTTDMFTSAGVPAEGIIIDTTSGRYASFGVDRMTETPQRPTEGGNAQHEVLRFDRLDRSIGKDNADSLNTSQKVSDYVRSLRFEARPKVSYLVMNNNLEVVGHFHTDFDNFDNPALAEEMASVATKLGGNTVSVYGNCPVGYSVRNLQTNLKRLSGGSVSLVDALQMNESRYWSARDDGYISETPINYEETEGREAKESLAREGVSEGTRLRAIEELEPIAVERNEMSREELRDVYNNLPSVNKDGNKIEFYRSAFKKIYKEGGLFGQIVPVLDEVLEQSVFAYSEPDNRGGQVRSDGSVHKEHYNVISFDNYVGKVEIAGKEYYVRTTVQREKSNVGTHAFFVSNVEVYQNPTESRTIPITSRGTTDFDGIVDAKLRDFFERASNELLKSDMEERISELSDKLNTPVRVVTEAKDVEDLPSARHRRSKGFYDPKTGEIVVVLPNNIDVADVENTLVHEVVGHDGLRALVGKERMQAFVDEIYDHAGNKIRKEIDNRTQRLVDAEADRLRVRKSMAREEAGEDVNANYYTDMAGARTEAEAKREQFRREATEEYMSDMAGKIGDEGFEKMSRDEQTLWGRIKARVQKFLDAFLRKLKIPARIRLTDKDLAYILFKSWKNKVRTAQAEKGGGFAEAEDAVMRRKTGWDLRNHVSPKKARVEKLRHSEPVEITGDEIKYSSDVKEFKKNAIEYGKKLQGVYTNEDTGKAVAFQRGRRNGGLKEILQHDLSDEAHIKSVAAVPQIIEKSVYIESRPNNDIEKNPDVKRYEHYVCGLRIGGEDYTVHSIVAEDKNGERYYDHKLSHIEKGKLLDFIEAKQPIEQILAPMPDTKSTIRSERKVKELISLLQVPDEEKIIRFRDPDMGLEETITRLKAEAMQANTDNLQAKRDAMRAIGGNLNHLRSAMARQREYDITTVKSITDLAKIFLENNLFDDLSKYETKRILGTINNVIGKQDVSKYVQNIMDIMVDNQLRQGANTLGRLLSIRGSRVDARGIEVQGELDPDGQAIAKVVRKSTSLPKDDIDTRISEAINRMGSSDQAIADEATIEYAGLQIARQYVEDITESKAEEKALRDSIKQAKGDYDAGNMTEAAYRQYVSATEDAIRQNKIERAEAFHSLVEQVGGMMSESIERAKAWREAEKQRVEDIQHNANSDMEGRPTDEHHKNDRIQKLSNNSFARFMLAPLATFDQMLRMFGKKNVRGEGYLWNRYMRGWVDATEREYLGYRKALEVLDDKVSEVFGSEADGRKGYRVTKWGDLFAIDRKLPKATVNFWDGGDYKDHELTQGNLLYIYMADKMADGRMKLRRMGITEEDVADIANFLDPRFIELADWMQEEFLVDKRNEYNEVHKRMFGASMAAIENYFPLKILANARLENIDVADDTTDTALPATSTGSIIKRRRNNLALDVTGANAFSVILDHLQQMERWAAFAEFNRDLNTLLSYKRFRNQVMNMSSVYGGGKTLWNNFRNVCSMAAGAYRPPIAALDKSAVNIAKGVTAAKVSFRVFTALKQFLSLPAYVSDSNPLYLAKNLANPFGAWKWSMKNLPIFEKRWKSRMAGDPRLLKSDMDWKMWRSRIVEIASRVGMSPNAFVDALTVAIGTHAMYETKKAKYLRWGMSEADADRRAKQDTTILFNQTQQSSEGAFLSTMQVDHSWLSVLFTVFRNSSMSYTRQLYDAMRNLGRYMKPGYADLTEEFMAKQMRRDGIDPDKADTEAKREYRRGILRNLVKVGIFGFALQMAWNLGAYLPYLILGDDEDEKDKMWDDVMNHSMFGAIEGVTGGDVLSSAGNMWISDDWQWKNLSKDMPLSSDIQSILQHWDNDKVSAMNDVINLLVQSGVGVNPQSLTDAVVAVMDYCGDDAQTSRECALLISRILNCPQSQIDKIYFDEIDASAREASQMTPGEIAERYARYKVRRGAPLTGWAYGSEAREKAMNKYRDRSDKIAKERIGAATDKATGADMSQALSDYENVKAQLSQIKRVKNTDEDRYYDLLDEIEATPEFERYEIVKDYKKDVDELTKEWLRAKTVAERDSCAKAIIELKREMVNELKSLQEQSDKSMTVQQ